MKHPDALDSAFVAWVEDATQTPVPAAALARVLAAISSRQPRPARIARFGSHWVDGPSRGAAPFGMSLGLPFPGARLAVLVLLFVLTLIGAAFIGSRRVEPPLTSGRLVYDLGGEIYLADAVGANPVRVASGGLASEAIWAPSGRHFLFHDDGAQITDADGQVVASFENLPGFNGYPTWSPDSTRLQAWTRGFTRITIYDTDGVVQAELRLPDGYGRLRENLGLWAPDGRSVWVQITRGAGPGLDAGETWELPVDGSRPRRIMEHLALMGGSHVSFAPDGTQMAFSGRGVDPTDWVLYVANSDGTEVRPLVRVDDDANNGEGMLPVWSPDGEEVAYFVRVSDVHISLKVVDVATGTARTVGAPFGYADWPPHRWSPDGSKLLASKVWGTEAGGLWSLGPDGGPATLLVEGATTGEWQPIPLSR